MKRVWIGLVGVVPRPSSNSLLNPSAKGAFVNALAYVNSEAEYIAAVEKALEDLRLSAFEFEDVEPFLDRVSRWEVDPELRVLADDVVATGDVRFGTFHNYSALD